MPECDVEDILCQFEILRAYRGLQKNLGKEEVLEKFPELEEVSGKIANEISLHRDQLKEAIEKCGGFTEEEITEEIERIETTEE